MPRTDSTYTVLNIRFARVTRAAAGVYIEAQKEILGRTLSFTQLVNDCLIEKLERDGFLPRIVSEEPAPDEPSSIESQQIAEIVEEAEKPWETT